MKHLIVDEHNHHTAHAKDIIVYFDFIKNTKMTIPQELQDKIKCLEKYDLPKSMVR